MTNWMFPRRLDRPEIMCATSSTIAEVKDGGLQFFVGLTQLS